MQGTYPLPADTRVPRPAARILQYWLSQADFHGTLHNCTNGLLVSIHSRHVMLGLSSLYKFKQCPHLAITRSWLTRFQLYIVFQKHSSGACQQLWNIVHCFLAFTWRMASIWQDPIVSKMWHCSYPSRRQWQHKALPNFWQMTKNFILLHMHLGPCNPVNEAENHWLLHFTHKPLSASFLQTV